MCLCEKGASSLEGLTPRSRFTGFVVRVRRYQDILRLRPGRPAAAVRSADGCLVIIRRTDTVCTPISLSLYVFSPSEQVKCLFSFSPRSPHRTAPPARRFPAAAPALRRQRIVLRHLKHQSLFKRAGLLSVHVTPADRGFHSLVQTRALLDNPHGPITFLRICVPPLCVFIVPKKRIK